MSDTAKRCGRCGELKPVGEFNADSATRDGFQASCRTCMRAYQADHDEKNRERHIARVRQDNLRRESVVAAELKAYLREHPCVGCGTTDARVLECSSSTIDPASRRQRTSPPWWRWG